MLAQLDTFVRPSQRDEQYGPFRKGHFDLWGCAQPHCPHVMPVTTGGCRCSRCRSLICSSCVFDASPICIYCDALECLVGNCSEHTVDDDGSPITGDCDVCGDTMCWRCITTSGYLLPYCKVCNVWWVRGDTRRCSIHILPGLRRQMV